MGRALRATGLVAALLSAIGVFLSRVTHHLPFEKWLFWSYAEYWALCALFTAACWSSGDAIVRRLVPRLPAAERVVFALTAGALSFFLVTFIAGLLGSYGTAFFFAAPAAMLLSGGRPSLRFIARLARHVGASARRWPPRLPALLATALGLVGVGMVYFHVINPDNLAYDARWYHLPIAEHYAAQGGIRRFPEGWYPGTLPHLASVVFTWAFLLPASDVFDRVELCSHLEFLIFLWTLASVPVLVRACLRRARRAGALGTHRPRVPPSSGLSSWAALFLFPGVLLYDSSLCGVADHVAAFWAVPVLLALFRGFRSPDARSGTLLAIPLSGALLTKYQGIFLAALPIGAVFVSVLLSLLPIRSAFRNQRSRVIRYAAAALGAGLVLTAPHWLKNWVWYGDPVYPFLHQHFRPRPWTVDAPELFHRVFTGSKDWAPAGTTSEKLLEALRALVTFSFHPHDWPFFHRDLPVFGSLLTLSLLPLIFLRHTQRVWIAMLAAHSGVFVWYMTYHQDRYLQALVPWMAVGVAATVRLAWAAGFWSRLSACFVIGLQIVWGGDVYFFPTHGVLKASVVKSSIDMMSKAFRGQVAERRSLYGAVPKLGATLPRGSKVLVHDGHFHLGLGAMSVSDVAPWQGGISYGRLSSPAAIYDQLHSYGVTHLLWGDALERDSMAGDFMFLAFANRYGHQARMNGELRLASMPASRPPQTPWRDALAAVFVCNEGYAPGQYRLGDLTVPSLGSRLLPKPLKRANGASLVQAIVVASEFLAVDPRCHSEVNTRGFLRVGGRKKGTELWIKVGGV